MVSLFSYIWCLYLCKCSWNCCKLCPFFLKNSALFSFKRCLSFLKWCLAYRKWCVFYSEVWSQVSANLTREGWAQSQSQGLLSIGDKFKMADPVEGLRNLVLREIESICCSLRSRNPTAVLDVQQALENIDQIVYGVKCLDSVTRLPDDVYRDISSAKRIIENASSTSARTPRISLPMCQDALLMTLMKIS